MVYGVAAIAGPLIGGALTSNGAPSPLGAHADLGSLLAVVLLRASTVIFAR